MARTRITELTEANKIQPEDLLTAVSSSVTSPLSTKITVKTLSDSLTTVSSSISSSYALSASYALNAGVNKIIEGNYINISPASGLGDVTITGDPFPYTGNAGITGDLLVTGKITAQTLVVETVSSSVVYSSGSNIFGDELTDTQQLTGSVSVLGTFSVNGTSTFNGKVTANNLTGSLFGTSSWAEKVNSSGLVGDITLGTQTSGDYVATITAGGGLTGTATGEGSTPTIAVGTANNGIIINADNIELDTASSTFTGGVKNKLNADGVVSSSAFSSPSQGTLRATINGAITDVDLGLQTTDNVQFAQVTGSSALFTGQVTTNVDANVNSITIGKGSGNIASNLAIGTASLSGNTVGFNNTAVGTFALRCNTYGCSNTAVGASALSANTTGKYNVAVGARSLCSNTTGYSNIGIGFNAAYKLTTSCENIAIGNCALSSNITGFYNVAIGACALKSNTQDSNVAIGRRSMARIGVGIRNVAIGSYALYGAANSSGSANVAIGNYTLTSNTTGCYNVAIGTRTLDNNTSGCRNVAVGMRSLQNNTIGLCNVAIGYTSLGNNVTGCRNVSVGHQSGCSLQGSNNVVLGGYTGSVSVINANNNIFISDGEGNLKLFITGSTGYVSASGFIGDGSQLTGITAGGSITVADEGTAQGTATFLNFIGAGVSAAVASNTASITITGETFPYTGSAGITGSLILTGSFSVDRDVRINSLAVGRGGGNSVTNTVVGYNSLSTNTGINNTAVGACALRCNTAGDSNTAIGTKAMEFATSGCYNIAVGGQALCVNSTGGNNVAIGYKSLYKNTVGYVNTSIGNRSMGDNTSGRRNTAVGTSALRANTIGNSNVAVGEASLLGAVTGCRNIAVGYRAACGLVTGSNNLFLGGFTGSNFSNNNIFISDGEGNLRMFITGSTGYVSASGFIGDGSQLTGITAGGSITVADEGTAQGAATFINFIGSGVSAAVASNTASITITGETFPYTGSAGITGSLILTGSFSVDRDATINLLTVGRGGGSIATNTALGSGSLRNNTTGINNTAIGYSALRNNTTGFCNTAVGHYALCSNTYGYRNTAIGTCALRNNTIGTRNTAIGDRALCSNTTGCFNTAVGIFALLCNTYGCRNTAVGYLALCSNTTGTRNTSIGHYALRYNTTGIRNTAIGYQAGKCIIGSNNVLLGSYTGSNAVKASNNNIFISDGEGNLRMFFTGSDGTATFYSSVIVSGSIVVSGSNGAGIFSQGATLADYGSGISNSGSYMVWRAPFPCYVVKVYGYREGGGNAEVNAVRSGSGGQSFHTGSNLVLSSANVWTSTNTVENTDYSIGDSLKIIVSGSGGNNQVAVQVDFLKKF